MGQLVKFEIDHLAEMDLDAAQLVLGLDDTMEAYKEIQGPAMTMVTDGKIVGSAGITRLWPGLGEAWAIVSREIHNYPISFHRYARWLFPVMMESGKYHRVQAVVLADFYKGSQWVRSLGFNLESVMYRYGPNKENYFRYVILR